MSLVKRSRPTSSGVWIFMEKTSETEVECKICKSVYKYHKSTSTLLGHLKKKHPLEFAQTQMQENHPSTDAADGGAIDYLIEIESLDPSELTGTGTAQEGAHNNKQHLKYSKVWSFMETISDTEVKCLLCQSVMKNGKAISTLVTHLQTYHQTEFSEIVENNAASNALDDILTADSLDPIKGGQMVAMENKPLLKIARPYNSRKPSGVWRFMEKISETEVKCLLCHYAFKYHRSTTSLLNHIKIKHSAELAQTKEVDSITNGIIMNHPITSSATIYPVSSAEPTAKTKVHTLKRPRAPSGVWRFMEKISETEVRCMTCNSVFAYHKSTSTLLSHLRSKHPEAYSQIQIQASAPAVPNSNTSHMTSVSSEVNSIIRQANQSAVSSTFNGHHTAARSTLLQGSNDSGDKGKKYRGNSERKKYLDRLLLETITLDLQPLTLVDDNGFKKFIHSLDGKYILPTGRHVTNVLLPSLYADEKNSLEAEISQSSDVAITTDIWTSRQSQDYITVSAHYLTSDWEMKSAVLETTRLIANHTASNVAEELYRIINAWSLEQRISCVVTDNGPNVVAAICLLDLPHIPCYAHTLNLVVQNSMKNVTQVFDLKKIVRDTVSFFHQNTKCSGKLVKLQLQLVQEDQNQIQNKQPLELKQEVDSRWNSTYYMLERYLELSDVINQVLYDVGKHELVLSGDEVETIRCCTTILKPFERATSELLIEKYTPLSKVIPITKAIRQILSRNRERDSTRLSEELESQMTRVFGRVEEEFLFGASTLLDPRFKKFPFSSTSAAEAIEVQLTGQMQCLIKEEQSAGADCSSSVPGGETAEDSEALWSCFDQEMKETIVVNVSSKPSGPEAHIRKLYEEETLQRLGDPLLWWKKREHHLTKLVPSAKKYLAIPATHVPPERVFSDVGDLISQRRENLADSAVNEILFLNKRLLPTP